MSPLRALIVRRIQAKGPGPFWLLDVYVHLTERGASSDDALEALRDFVDEIIAAKHRQLEELVK